MHNYRLFKQILAVLLFFPLYLFTFTSFINAATLSLSPAEKSISVNNQFTVNVLLDTEGANTDGTDAIITYNSTYLSVVSAALGDLYDTDVTTNTTTAGKITLSAIASTGSTFSGSGTFATITFKAIKAGTANISFAYTSGSTTDSNVTSNQTDVLDNIIGSTITITASSDSGTGGTGSDDDTATYTPPETGAVEWTIVLVGLSLGGFLTAWLLQRKAL